MILIVVSDIAAKTSSQGHELDSSTIEKYYFCSDYCTVIISKASGVPPLSHRIIPTHPLYSKDDMDRLMQHERRKKRPIRRGRILTLDFDMPEHA